MNNRNHLKSIGRRVVSVVIAIMTIATTLGMAVQPTHVQAQDESTPTPVVDVPTQTENTPVPSIEAPVPTASNSTLTGQPPVQQDESSPWNGALNLSQSGSASRPVIAAESNGRIHVLWWDKFDGTKYTFSRADGTWVKPVNVSSIVGFRQRTNNILSISPPEELILLADGNGLIHAFWRNYVGDLMYARVQSGGTGWSAAVRLVTAPLVWDVQVGDEGVLSLAFIRASTVGTAVPGVYYRRLRGNAQWTEPTLIIESLYFRTQSTGDASINVAAFGREVLVAWNDPQLQQSVTAHSTNSGGDFGEPVLVNVGDIIEAAVPRNMKFLVLPGAERKLLRLWDAGGSCVLYQQESLPDDQWSEPIRVMEGLNGCLRTQRTYTIGDTKLFMVIIEPSGQPVLEVWDGTAWAEKASIQVAFLQPSTNDLVVLGCMNVSLSPQLLAVVGCDQKGDVWVTTSKAAPEQFVPVLQGAWSVPTILSDTTSNAGLPAVTTDSEGRIHALWTQSTLVDGSSSVSLAYARGDGASWSDISMIHRETLNSINTPWAVTDPAGMLHVTWSGGTAGQIYYSNAFLRDALVISDWSGTKTLSPLDRAGDSPVITVEANGKLHSVFLIPFNENRGVYYTSSSDAGVNWTPPVTVFDAAAAGWTVVRQATMGVDSQGRIHVAWSRAAQPDQDSPLGIYYSFSEDSGVTWKPAFEVAATADERPQLAIGPQNQIHLVWAHGTAVGFELIHQWSIDGGVSWSAPQRIPNLGSLSPDFGMVIDSDGVVHLAGVEQTREASASIFYIRWNGTNWVDHDNLRMGYSFAQGLGARVVLTTTGHLGVFSRIRVPTADSTNKFVIFYVGRQLPESEPVIVPTFTPGANTGTDTSPFTAVPTLAPEATPDLSGGGPSTGNSNLWQIGLVAAGMLIVTVVAVIRLGRRLGR